MASSTTHLQPGTEITAGQDAATFPTAYSSFAISVDSRDAEKKYHAPGTPSILKHGKSRSFNHSDDPYYAGYAKMKGSPPLGSSKHGVRFSISEKGWKDASTGKHGRRSSTAAVMEFIRQRFPEHQHKPPVAITPKRAFLLFCIVFSATYLATALVPLLTGERQRYPGDIMAMKRGAGYYGNSHIFQGGENLADPHAAGDEHHQYIHHQQVSSKAGRTGEGPIVKMPSERAVTGNIVDEELRTALPKKLKSSTLAEQARLEELRAELAQQEDSLPAFKHVEQLPLTVVDLPSTAKLASTERKSAVAPLPNRKLAMPFNKLSDKAKTEETKTAGDAVAEQLGPVVPRQQESARKPLAATPASLKATEEMETVTEGQEDEQELEAEIAKLRKEAAARRQSRKAGAAQGQKARMGSSEEKPSARDSGKGAGEKESRLKKVERVGAKLGLVAKNRQAMFDGTAKEMEVAALLSD